MKKSRFSLNLAAVLRDKSYELKKSNMNYPEIFDELKCCVLIPTYNNAQSIAQVIKDVLRYTSNVIVVNDGSTDDTLEVTTSFEKIDLVSYGRNVGKGNALQKGFKRAYELGYAYAISIDADGQHFAKDLPQFLAKIKEQPNSLLIGARNMDQDSVPGGSSFGNRFSNFWFKLETGISLPDTQSGYRLYPLASLSKMKFFTKKYEFEIEVIVRAAWKGIKVDYVPVSVYYPPPDERVSHFRPFKDFSRISVLNTVLVLITFLYIKPRDFWRYIKKKRLREHLYDLFLKKDESILRKSLAVMLGIFMGIAPIWGFQLVVAIGLAYLLRLNRAIVILAANISIPPMIPVIISGSYLFGAFLLGEKPAIPPSLTDLSVDTIWKDFTQYFIGSLGFGATSALLLGAFTYALLIFMYKDKKSTPKTKETA